MIVFDSSALIALAKREAGAELVGQNLAYGHIGVINASEFIQKLIHYGDDGEKAFEKLEQLGLVLHDDLRLDAYRATKSYELTKAFGLSLADRFCLALAYCLDAVV